MNHHTPPSELLWFDVEQGYKTISFRRYRMTCMLWFDVEQGYKTIVHMRE